jgi:hypothetical protein
VDTFVDVKGAVLSSQVKACQPGDCLGGSNCSCSRGRWGPLCQSCIKTYLGHNESFFKQGGSCEPCPDYEGQHFFAIFVPVVCSSFIFYADIMRMEQCKSASDEIAVALRYFQQLSLLVSFDFSWPPEFFNPFRVFLNIVSFNVLQFMPIECTGKTTVADIFWTRLIVLPWLLFVFFFSYLLWSCKSRVYGKPSTEAIKRRADDLVLTQSDQKHTVSIVAATSLPRDHGRLEDRRGAGRKYTHCRALKPCALDPQTPN